MEWAVDIPNSNDPPNAWINMDYFDSREAAIAFVKEMFGGDDNGRICLVSEMPEDDEA